MQFDLKTFSAVTVMVTTALAIAMYVNWHAQKHQPGTVQWAIAFGMSALGAVLFRFQVGGFSSLIWAVLSGTLFFVSWCLTYLGLCRFLSAPCLGLPRVAGAALLHLMLMFWFTEVDPDQPLRLLVYLTANTLVIGSIGYLLWRESRHNAEPGIYRFMTGLCGFHLMFNLIRMGAVLTGRVIFEKDNTLPPALAASFMEGLMLSILMATSCIIMISQRIRQQLEIMVRTDDLSGLGNRRHFMDSIHREADRARRYGRPLSLVVLDIDQFKRINDTHGHPCGDTVIHEVGAILRKALREQDITCRIGGEEFGILMPETGGTVALASAERLRVLLTQARVENEGCEVTFTASFGVTELAADEKGVEALLQRADRHLYTAKQLGRNQVIGASAAPSLAEASGF